MARASIWLAALWWGSLTTLGFLVVPLLFVHLPSAAIAGRMAARLFSAQTWVSGGCALLLLMLSARLAAKGPAAASPSVEGSNMTFSHVLHRKFAIIYIVTGLLLAFLVEFAVAPKILTRDNLKLWHAVGSGMYLVQWVCAGVVLWKLTATPAPTPAPAPASR
jgi:Domain of unknown function (DUF4149)